MTIEEADARLDAENVRDIARQLFELRADLGLLPPPEETTPQQCYDFMKAIDAWYEKYEASEASIPDQVIDRIARDVFGPTCPRWCDL